MIGGEVNAPRGNGRGAPLIAFGGAKFMQGMFTTIKQVVRHTVQAIESCDDKEQVFTFKNR